MTGDNVREGLLIREGAEHDLRLVLEKLESLYEYLSECEDSHLADVPLERVYEPVMTVCTSLGMILATFFDGAPKVTINLPQHYVLELGKGEVSLG